MRPAPGAVLPRARIARATSFATRPTASTTTSWRPAARLRGRARRGRDDLRIPRRGSSSRRGASSGSGEGRRRFGSLRPVYDGDLLALSGRIVARSGRRERGRVVAEIEARSPRGEVAASLTAGLAWGGPVIAADPRGYPAAPLPASPPPATAETLASLDPLGAPALLLDPAPRSPRPATDLDDPSPSYRGPEAVAHPGLLLRQANRALSENVALGPWIHVSSDVAHCDLARAGDRLETRGRVARRLRAEGAWLGRPRSSDRRRRDRPDRPHPPHRHLSHAGPAGGRRRRRLVQARGAGRDRPRARRRAGRFAGRQPR